VKPLVLITGAAGGLARVMAAFLEGAFDLIGVDPRPMPWGSSFPGKFIQVDYRRRQMAEVFRQNSFHGFIHLGRLPMLARAGMSTRYNVNVLGTRNLLELAAQFKIPHLVVMSTFHVYGAHQHNHLQIKENDPLRAGQIFPQISDAVELDLVSTIFSLQHPDTRTIILRPANIIGPKVRNQISLYLRQPLVPMLMGYDPLLQFVHETDIARALALCLASDRSGIYNVAGEGVVPYSQAIRLAGGKPFPFPHVLAYPVFSLIDQLGFRFPKHLIDYFRYPTVISDEAFRRDFGYVPNVSTVEALKSLRE